MNDDEYLIPPETAYDIIESPDGNAIEIAMMKEHRFTFYYWLKWFLRKKILTFMGEDLYFLYFEEKG